MKWVDGAEARSREGDLCALQLDGENLSLLSDGAEIQGTEVAGVTGSSRLV